MLTDEKIEEIAHRSCRKYKHAEECKYQFDELTINYFARKLLSEVRLEDMLKLEEAFIRDNANSFEIELIAPSTSCSYEIIFDSSQLRLDLSSGAARCIHYDDYRKWKQTIEVVSDE